MKSYKKPLDDIIHAWLNRQDNVQKQPTWNTLIDALKKIGQAGIAQDIRECYTLSASLYCMSSKLNPVRM